MSKKCRAFSASKIGRGAPEMTLKEAFYAGWDAALSVEIASTTGPEPQEVAVRGQGTARQRAGIHQEQDMKSITELNMEAEREAFEAAVRELDVPSNALDRWSHGDYVNEQIAAYWSGWKMARRAVEAAVWGEKT
jgi:hypothetical protein